MANWFKVKRKLGGVGGPLEPGEFGLEDGTNQGLWIGATNPDGTTKQVLVNASSFQGIQKLGITDLNECDGVNNWYFCESDSVARTLGNSPVEVSFTLHSMWIKNWGYASLGAKLLQVLRTHTQEWERYATTHADGVPVWNPWVEVGASAFSAAIQAAIDGIAVGGRNLIVQKTITLNKYLDKTGSVIATGSWGWFYTDYIPVKPGEQTICSGYINLGFSPSACFYTSDKTFLSGISNDNVAAAAKLTVPENAAYLRFSAEISDLPTIKLEKGNKATDWTPAPENTFQDFTNQTIDLNDYAPNNGFVNFYGICRSDIGSANIANKPEAKAFIFRSELTRKYFLNDLDTKDFGCLQTLTTYEGKTYERRHVPNNRWLLWKLVSQDGIATRASTSDKWTTARTFQTNLASTTAVSVDGSANVTPGVTGTLPLANGGTGATTAAAARTELGAAAESHNHSAANITSGTLPVTRGGTGAATLASGEALIGNGTGAVSTRAITTEEASSSTSLITAGGVFAVVRKRVYTTLFTGSTPTSATPSATLNTENFGFYTMLRVRATVQWAAATPVIFWIPSAQLSESTNNVAMYTLCLANSSSTSIFTINAKKTDASTIQFSGATMSITDIVGVR